MWARVIELLLAGWLALSPWIFTYPQDARFWMRSDLTCAALLALFSLLSFHPRLGRAHLLEYFVAGWFLAVNFTHGYPLPPFLQNTHVLALLYIMLAAIPSHCHEPPRLWKEFLASRGKP